jgi:hypothetical protein
VRFSKFNGALWIGVIALVYFFVAGVRVFWTSYWLAKDAKQSVALITRGGAHGVVDYTYAADDHQYTGSSRRNWENEKYRNVFIGEQSIVYFSASHPWISSLETPLFPPRTTLFYGLVILFLSGWVLAYLQSRRPAPAVQGGVSARATPDEEVRLRWYHEIWLALPFVLLLFGGAVGGACGGAAWSVNRYVFRHTERPGMRYLWTGLITILAVAVFAGFIALAMHNWRQ